MGLTVSDLCAGFPDLFDYGLRQIAHMALGAVASLLPNPLATVVGVLWLGKELGGDLPGCGWVTTVWLDSAADLAFGAGGFIAMQRWRQ